MKYTVRPIQGWADSTPASQRRSRWTFRVGWSETIDLLMSELDKLGASNIVMQLDVDEKDIRLDGQLRANATPRHPGVRIVFDTRKHGTLAYETDSCAYWQHNVRSIALGLEALRAVDRYGITRSGEQYKGWRQLEAGPARRSPEQVLRDWADSDGPVDEKMWRAARSKSHPDRHDGDQTGWDEVEEAARQLGFR